MHIDLLVYWQLNLSLIDHIKMQLNLYWTMYWKVLQVVGNVVTKCNKPIGYGREVAITVFFLLLLYAYY